MSFRVRYTRGARDDLKRLYGFLLEYDLKTAARALEAIRKATELLTSFPFTCRKVDDTNPFLREFVITFGDSGYVALFEIEGAPQGEASPASTEVDCYVTILAVRHQREDDYH
ncbi:MAG TPA: type II toxin-antitoxin system RelE/ParE family toxin [Paraburkholderia sp.]|uniref:type II toxin-antitoxin system RelE/ParE family toxin n=1 Tax=Paraburkholderia sp. TaxID=1926495 RepID=UPI002B479791|nr:type II toxin-antitoxin system RelE/ParE family toxin [Paraburkholderia sp.]HKR40217.1 type II toxin-antitoxin system RelE/ParE family toxin [Paraburkholderia sp.]